MWDLFEERHLFCGDDPDGKGYSTRAHLAEVMGLLGPPPLDMLKRGKRSHEFFLDDGKHYLLLSPICNTSLTIDNAGKWKQDIVIPTGASLEQSEEFLDGKNKEMFINFLRGMLQWRPEDRKTAMELLQDPWLNS